MPRRNLLILVLMTVVAVLCRERVQSNYVRVFANAMNKIENRALDPAGTKTLFEGAMYGMLGQLDGNSQYLSPADLKDFNEDLDRQFAGIGVDIGVDPETKDLTISPLVNSPAAKAGILAGDRILSIGKTIAKGMSLQEASSLLRGKVGSSVTLTVLHEGQTKPQEVTIVRGNIQGDSVRGDSRNADGSWEFFLEGRDRIGYLRITTFNDNTVNELKQALAAMTRHHMRGLVLDLRDDPGGYLDAGVGVCDLLIDSGVIVTTRGRDGRIFDTYSAGGDAPFTGFPVAVVVNQLTASASEIVAACLQDHHRAVIVGQRTYGKGTVQDLIELEPGCGLMKLTTKSFWRPSGKNIHRLHDATAKDEWGVSPDKGYKVELSDDEVGRWRVWRMRRDLHQAAGSALANGEGKPFADRQLLRAIEYVEKESAKRESPKPTGK